MIVEDNVFETIFQWIVSQIIRVEVQYLWVCSTIGGRRFSSASFIGNEEEVLYLLEVLASQRFGGVLM